MDAHAGGRDVALLRAKAGGDVPFLDALQALEAMLAEGCIKGKVDRKKPLGLNLTVDLESPMMHYART